MVKRVLVVVWLGILMVGGYWEGVLPAKAQASSCGAGDIQDFVAISEDGGPPVPGRPIIFRVRGAPPTSSNRQLYVVIDPNFIVGPSISPIPISIGPSGDGDATLSGGISVNGEYLVAIFDRDNVTAGSGAIACSTYIRFTIIGGATPTPTPVSTGGCRNLGETCVSGVTPICDANNCCATSGGTAGGVVRRRGDPGVTCIPASTVPPGAGGCGAGSTRAVETAIGCIPTGDLSELAVWLATWLLGISGGIAFLLIVVAAFQIMTSSGDPGQMKSGQQLITAAVSGLLFIIFSLFLLRLIAGDILKIPGLT